MKKTLKIIGWILLILLTAIAIAWFGFLKPKPPPISAEDRAAVNLMPLPAELKLGKGELLLNDALAHDFPALSTPKLERAVERFYEKLSSQTGMDLGKGSNKVLILECNGSEKQYPSLGDDESYIITVSEKKILVEAPEETGIIYALESLLQLAKQKEGEWVIPVLSMDDRPRFPWRGVMIDVCRHWVPKEVILRNLEAMGTLKMNVFHWHLTEHQGFRVESKLFPKLHEMGSNGDYYTQDDIRDVLEYAADRGIRVIPEFDIPGHTAAWFVGHPELASGPGHYQLDTGMMGAQPVMDPTREEVYGFLDQFFGEMAGLFPDKYLHIGGDEVVPTQWNENPDIQRYMIENELEDPHALQAHFNIRLQKIVAGHGKIMVGWDEILHPDLPKEGIAVQTWRDHSSLWESARLGNRAILSAGYYLDHKHSASYHYNVDPTVIAGAVDIEIDSTNWKGWGCTLSMADMVMDGTLYLFGEGEALRGIMNFMGGSVGFIGVTEKENRISFVVETSMGDLEFETEIKGDSISGFAKFSVFNLTLNGHRSGGTDMEDGTPLPEFKKIVPLTPEQESNLMGGEACMWSEMVDYQTIESRIWPRAAAIAEKLWSPKVLTGDVKDMYRRLMVMDDRLENLGLKQRTYKQTLINDLVAKPYRESLMVLTDLLQEEKMFARMALYDPQLYTTTPLNRMVDMALPESYVAYQFGQDVDLWIESADQGAREAIIKSLKTWSANHDNLSPAFEGNERLLEVRSHSEHLSKLADVALVALSDPATLIGKENELKGLFTTASETYGATLLAVVEHVQKLIESATKN
ncbi:MAG: beta-N-acetylhexosaminidase [Bacteroidales bacterium]|nr:beta-N-acetylhexosaminidase [Bacteroidales bacterium]